VRGSEKMKVEIPGIGGNLGECVLCGKSFLTEILTGENVTMMHVQGFDRKLPFHNQCAEDVAKITDGDWKKLPSGPLRQEFEEAAAKLESAKAVRGSAT
jgi:hypothetical protein